MNNIGKNIMLETLNVIWDNIRYSVYTSTWVYINATIAYDVSNEKLHDAIKDNIGVEIFDNVGFGKARIFNIIPPLTQKIIKEQILNNDKN